MVYSVNVLFKNILKIRSFLGFGVTIHVTHLFFFSGSNEEEEVLKTNKEVYSLLLRATADKSVRLLERIEVILTLLEQLTRNTETNNTGIQ